jgi:predicted HAD superfamily Cof-like phosphohydrolase
MYNNKLREEWVREFHLLNKDDPKVSDEYTVEGLALRYKLIEEEANELLKELWKASFSIQMGLGVSKEIKENILKELCDLQVVLSGAVVQFKDLKNFEPAFVRVCKSNMSKADPVTGKLEVREDGKILKSKHYLPSELGDLV